MKICTVTITGADDSVDPKDMAKLSHNYPFVEWSILLAPCDEGCARYPSRKWTDRLIECSNDLRLAGHLCGTWASDTLHGKLSFRQDRKKLWSVIKRLTINFKCFPAANTTGFLDSLALIHDKQIILQIDTINDDMYTMAKENGLIVYPQYNSSQGSGVLPSGWPNPLDDVYCGYAGGLGPDNLERELKRIAGQIGDRKIWIDMETRVRTGKFLDLRKVEECLQIAEDYVDQEDRAAAYLEIPSSQKRISDSIKPPR